MSDAVNHPLHYGGSADPYETIKVMRARLTPQEYVGALKFNIYKYQDRHRAKNGLQDLLKAQFYMNELVTYLDVVNESIVYPYPDVDAQMSAEAQARLNQVRIDAAAQSLESALTSTEPATEAEAVDPLPKFLRSHEAEGARA